VSKLDEEWRGISVAAELGGLDVAGWVREQRVQLNALFEKYCALPYTSEVTGIALALRVEGNVKSYGFEGIENIQRLRPEKVIAADVSVQRKDWERDPTSFRVFLWRSVQEGIWACVARLKEDRLVVDEERLRLDLAKVASEFLTDSAHPTARHGKSAQKAKSMDGGSRIGGDTPPTNASGVAGLPQKIKIQREKDYHTHYIGRCEDGTQFMGFILAAPTGSVTHHTKRKPKWFAVVHRFDSKGDHLNTEAVFLGARAGPIKLDQAGARLTRMIEKLGRVAYGDVEVSLFSVRVEGHVFGLVDASVPEEGYLRIDLVPNGLAFFPPWDGTYST